MQVQLGAIAQLSRDNVILRQQVMDSNAGIERETSDLRSQLDTRATVTNTALALLPTASWAQRDPIPVIPGTISTTGCPPGVASCFVPSAAGGGGGTVTQGAAGTAPWLVSLPANATIAAVPSSVTPTACQGGTGAVVATVGATATPVCAAGTARSYWRIGNMAASGAPYVYCTDDGSVPTLTHWTFVAYPQGYQDTTGMQVVSPAALSCIASVATTISALAVQTGAAP